MNDPRTEAMNTELIDEQIPEYFEPDVEPVFLSIEDDSQLLEHEMLSTLLKIMRTGSRDSDRRAAASDVGELIGKKGKNQVQIIKANNLQLNQVNHVDDNLKAHLIESAKGLAAITDGQNANIKSKQGGQGV